MTIDSLELESFGKYSKTRFDFKPVTVFFGRNESGKTTILDALFLQLLDRAVNSGTLQLLQTRYGVSGSKLKPELLCKTLSLSELENFYIVRSSRIPVEFSGNADAGTIKTRLLDGRVNIQTLLDDLKRELGERAENSVGKRRAKLRQLAQTYDKEIRDYDAGLDAYAEKAALLQDAMLALKTLEEERQRKERSKAEAAKKRQELRASEERGAAGLLYDRVRQWLAQSNKYRAERQDWNLRYGTFDAASFEAMLEQETALRQKLDAGREAAAEASKQREARQVTASKLKVLNVFLPIGLLCFLAFAGGIAAGIIMRTYIPYIFSGVALVGALVALLARYAKVQALVAETRLASGDAAIDSLGKVREFAAAKSGTEAEVSIENITRELGRLEKEKEERFRSFNIPHAQALRAMIAEKAKVETALEVTRKNLEVSVPRAELTAQGFTLENSEARDDAGLARLSETIAGIAGSLQAKLGQDEPIALPELRAKLRSLDEELRNTDNELSALAVKKDRLMERKAALQTELASFSQKIAARAELKKRNEACHTDLDNLEREEKAKLMVKDILEHMQEGRNTELQFIEEGMERYFSPVFAPFSSIKVSDIGKDGILMPDTGGRDRPLPLLSQGTQDLFYTGFRMLLGEYLWETKSGASSPGGSSVNRRDGKGSPAARTKPGFFLWDEPFVSLDSERLEKAVRMLMLFQEKTGFQHVLFTKDPDLVKLLKKHCPGASLVVHELSPM